MLFLQQKLRFDPGRAQSGSLLLCGSLFALFLLLVVLSGAVSRYLILQPFAEKTLFGITQAISPKISEEFLQWKAEVAENQSRWAEADSLFSSALKIVPAGEIELRRDLLVNRALNLDAWATLETDGDRRQLRRARALALYGQADAANSSNAKVLDRVRDQGSIGATFYTRAAVPDSPTLLENLRRAILSFRFALALLETNHVKASLDWAFYQNSLGNALLKASHLAGLLDHRLPDFWLAEAIAHYQLALTVRTRQALPQKWAATETNIGDAYSLRAALLTPGDFSLKGIYLGMAIDAFRSALEVRTQEATPVEWAQANNNLATALCQLAFNGTVNSSSQEELLTEAEQAYDSTLDVYTAEDFPREHTLTQANLELAESKLEALHLQDLRGNSVSAP